MKTLRFLVFIFVIFLLNFELFAQGSFEFRLVARSTDSFYMQARATDASYLPEDCNNNLYALIDLTFIIRWDTAYNVNFGNPNNIANSYLLGDNGCSGGSAFAMTTGTTRNTNGAFHYRIFQMINIPSETKKDWVDDEWYDIVGFKMDGTGSGLGTLEIAPQGWPTSGPGSSINHPNINFGDGVVYPTGNDFTPSINGSATNVSLGVNIVWDGDQNDNDWFDGNNWSSGTVPTQYQGVTIPASLSHYPILTNAVNIKQVEIASGASVSLNGNTLHIRGELSGSGEIIGSATSSLTFSGTSSSTLIMDDATPGTTNALANLTIATSGTVTLSNAVEVFDIVTLTSGTLASAGNLRLGATSVTDYAQIAPTGSGTITGNVVMEKFLKNTNAGWRHYYMPLNGTLSGFTGIDIKVSNPENVFYWDASDAGSNVAEGWQAGALANDRSNGGYTIYSDNGGGGDFDISQTISYTGTYVSGNTNFTLHGNTDDPNAGAAGTEAEGWHLIGNPYPSNLSMTAMFTDWASNGALDYKAIHIWDAVNGQYKAFLDGVTIENYNGSVTAGNDSNVIAPFQAFWVKAATGETSFTIENDHRTTDMADVGIFMKKNYDLVRLDVISSNGKWDQTVVYFHDNGSTSFDNGLDAYKLISMNAEVPSLYAVGPDGKFAITALSTQDYVHSIPLGFRSEVKGEMTFSLNLSELDAKWFVYLEDKELGIFYDIKANPYTFTHTHNSDSRFVLHIQEHALSADKLVSDVKEMKVSGNGEDVYVYVPEHYRSQTYAIEVYDLQGRLVYSNARYTLQNGMNTLNIRLDNSAIYVVKVKSTEGMTSGKIVIR